MVFKSNENPMFRSSFSESIFQHKYAHEGSETWERLAHTLVKDVCGNHMFPDEQKELAQYITDLKFIPGGRYLYYAGRPNKFFNNCYLLKAEEDTREDWADLSWKSESALMTGGGIGIDYSVYRGEGEPIYKTGGEASGPIPKMMMINEIGRRVMQGGSRRSAIYASLARTHPDVEKFIVAKDWHHMPVGNTGQTLWDIKQSDFNFPAPLDFTNISVNYGTDWLRHSDEWCNGIHDADRSKVFGNYNDPVFLKNVRQAMETKVFGNYNDPVFLKNVRQAMETKVFGNYNDPVFLKNVRQAMETAEPGFSFNFFDKENETLRNACTEVTSEDDSDVCNLGSLNLGRIQDKDELVRITHLATMFLLLGTLKAELPYDKVYEVRDKNRRLGLGLMGVHEWLLKRGYRYEVTDELHEWLLHYESVSDLTAWEGADYLGISRPVAVRAIAPTGSIGILAGTTTGIEPLFAVAYKRRYLKGKEWHWQPVVDGTAQELIDLHGVDPDNIESAIDLAEDYERRIKFQADVQDYVDQSISSTINLPAWGSEHNNEDTVPEFAKVLAKYAPRLRGFTCYPDGARGGQPLTPMPYKEAVQNLGQEFREDAVYTDICDLTGGGTCGV